MSAPIFNPEQKEKLHITDEAIAFFKKKLKTEEQQAIRISVKKSGCSGYSYVIGYGKEKDDSDAELIFDDLTIYINKDALSMIAGSEIVLKKQGLNKAIAFNNPNATGSCGCGSSFSVDEVIEF